MGKSKLRRWFFF